MDIEDMTPLVNHVQRNFKRKIPILFLALIWSLGIINWSTPGVEDNQDIFSSPIIGNFRLRRRPVFVLSVVSIFGMASPAIFGAVTYFMCYVGLKEHFFRFIIAVVCYGPSLMVGTVFFIPAFIKNNCRKSKRVNRHISWITVLQESTFLKRFSYIQTSRLNPIPKPWIFVFFHFCGLLVSGGVVLVNIEVYNNCLNWLSYVWLASELIGFTYLANFCYVLYLQRVILEEEYVQTESFIETNAGNLEDCTEKVKELFCNYFQLRKLFLLWLSIVFFSMTFGFAAYVTWSYNIPGTSVNSTISTTLFPIHPEGMQKACPYSCDDRKYLENQHFLFIYNALAIIKLFIPVILSFSVVKGLDIKYTWNGFILRLRLMSKTRESDFWNSLVKYSETLHPQTTMDTKLRFIIPVLGLAFGFLGGWKSHIN